MNTNLMFSSKTDLWETPQDLFNKYDAIYHFETDVCALPENAKCKRFFTPEMDGLKQEWTGVCWCNPPYGRQIGRWVEKAVKSFATVVMLLPARTDTKWFHDWCLPYGKIEFLRGRLKFGGCENSAPFPSMVVVFQADFEQAKQDACRIVGTVGGERMSRQHHYVKILPEYYIAVDNGTKTFEIRFNDRNYKVGDILHLQEFCGGQYTSRELTKEICYMIDSPDYCKDGFVVLGIRDM